MQIIAAEADPGGKRQGSAVNIVTAVRVDEVGEAGWATDAGERDDFFLRIIKFLENFIKRSEHGEIAAAGAPRGVVGDKDFFSQGRAKGPRRWAKGGRKSGSGHKFIFRGERRGLFLSGEGRGKQT